MPNKLNHSFCRRMVSGAIKELKGVKIRNLQAVKTNTCYYEVYNGERVGSFEGCCKWSAIAAYLDTLLEDYHA